MRQDITQVPVAMTTDLVVEGIAIDHRGTGGVMVGEEDGVVDIRDSVLVDGGHVLFKRKQHLPKTIAKKKKTIRNEEISSDEDLSADDGVPFTGERSDDEFEDVQQTAFRKAKQLLADIRAEEKVEEGEEDEEAIAHRLKEEALSHVATLHRRVASSAKLSDSVVQYRAHR
ncbi:unnamed protein product [Toxocara canis]|uniref:Uncharacterized protein n=1 Tax=Toxocara canis TaxID=6265 RepID=A0A183VF94_TOXCA|nr:unnamed protein product [Toxocara canis]